MCHQPPPNPSQTSAQASTDPSASTFSTDPQRQDEVMTVASPVSPARPDTDNCPSSSSSSKGTMYTYYAKHFALLTIVTAYLGNHATQTTPSTQAATSTAATTLFGLGLYGDHVVPRLVYSKELLLYVVCLYWIGVNCWKFVRYQTCHLVRQATDHALQKVASSSQALSSRIRSTVSATFQSASGTGIGMADAADWHKPVHKTRKTPKRQVRSTVVFSAPDSFVGTDLLNKMTLRDMAQVFSYGVLMNQISFDRTQFLTGARSVTQEVIAVMDEALAVARGPDVVPLRVPASDVAPSLSSSDSMDALAFAAVARIFAEWRSLRIVPSGYAKFGIGIGIARRDLIQNIGKIEHAVQDWLNFYQGVVLMNDPMSELDSPQQLPQVVSTAPTLRQLLRHELEVNRHPKLPALTDNSAASGLLWTKRQLEYQSYCLDNTARVPIDFPTPKAALYSAYDTVYGKYHGFLIKTVFQSTLNAAPPYEDVMRHINKPYLDERVARGPLSRCTSTTNSTTASQVCDEDMEDYEDDDSWIQVSVTTEETEADSLGSLTPPRRSMSVYHSSHLEDIEDEERHGEMELGDKVLQVFSSVFGHCVIGGNDNSSDQQNGDHSRNVTSSFHIVQSESNSSQVWRNSVSGDHEDTGAQSETDDLPYYLSVLRSLEGGLDKLINELNMNDPTRV